MEDRISIALIDDESDIVFIYAKELKNRGYDVFSTTKVDEFFTHLRQNTPNLVLIDMVIPEMPGWRICEKIRSIEEFDHVKIIGFSGVFTDDDDVLRLSTNVDMYLIKPVDFDVLDYTIRQLVQFS